MTDRLPDDWHIIVSARWDDSYQASLGGGRLEYWLVLERWVPPKIVRKGFILRRDAIEAGHWRHVCSSNCGTKPPTGKRIKEFTENMLPTIKATLQWEARTGKKLG